MRRHVELTIKRCMGDIFIDKRCLDIFTKHSKTRHMVWRFKLHSLMLCTWHTPIFFFWHHSKLIRYSLSKLYAKHTLQTPSLLETLH